MIRWVLLSAALVATPALAQDRLPDGGGGEGARSSDRGGDGRTRQVDVAPYLEVDQTVFAELSPGDEVTTYTSLAAGIDAYVSTRNSEGQISARYERRIAWDDDDFDDDIITGLARGSFGIGRSLSLEGGAYATRTRSFGGGPVFDFGDDDSVTNLYSVYAGPSFSTSSRGLDITGGYRFGYTKVESPDVPTGIPGLPRLDYYDDSTAHLAQLSVGSAPGRTLPFGWTVSGAYTREDVSQLDQRYEGWFVRGDVMVPLSPTLAAVGGVGWEDISISQRQPLVDTAGDPVIDEDGRFVSNRGVPRLIAYAEDALYWDVGVSWRPTQRSSLEVRVGERYDSFTAIGSLTWQFGRASVLQVGVYDTVDSFGRRLTNDLSELPTRFRTGRNAFGGNLGGCVFGVEEGAAGGCLSSALASLSTSNYRSRGVDAIVSSGRGRWSYGAGAGYAHRDYYAPDLGPGITLYGIEDQNAYLQAYAAYELSPRSSVDGQIYSTWYDPGFGGADLYSTGAVGTYNYRFGRFDALAALGVQAFQQDGFEDNVTASAQVGMRYNF